MIASAVAADMNGSSSGERDTPTALEVCASVLDVWLRQSRRKMRKATMYLVLKTLAAVALAIAAGSLGGFILRWTTVPHYRPEKEKADGEVQKEARSD